MFTYAYSALGHAIQLSTSGFGAYPIWPPHTSWLSRFRDLNQTETGSCFQFVKIMCTVEVLIVVAFGTLLCFSPQFARDACEATCLCWYMNPRYASGTWYDWGNGFAFGSVINSFIGDTFLTNFVGRQVGRYRARYRARRLPTQQQMDEAVRMRDPRYLPWRIVHLVKVYAFALILMPVMPFALLPLAVYHLLAVPVDRLNLLGFLETVPPSSGILMRYVCTVMLPLCAPLHFAVGIIGFVDQQLRTEASLLRGGAGGGTFMSYLNMPSSGALWGDRQKIASALSSGPIMLYMLLGGLCLCWIVVEIFVLQRLVALRSGVITPWQVVRAGLATDARLDGGILAYADMSATVSGSEPASSEKEGATRLHATPITHYLRQDQIARLYQPPTGVEQDLELKVLLDVVDVEHTRERDC